MMIKIECIKGDHGIYEGKNSEKANKPGNKPNGNKDHNYTEQMNILSLKDLRGKDVSFING